MLVNDLAPCAARSSTVMLLTTTGTGLDDLFSPFRCQAITSVDSMSKEKLGTHLFGFHLLNHYAPDMLCGGIDLANIGSSNDLSSDGTMLLPEPTLTSHHMLPVAFLNKCS